MVGHHLNTRRRKFEEAITIIAERHDLYVYFDFDIDLNRLTFQFSGPVHKLPTCSIDITTPDPIKSLELLEKELVYELDRHKKNIQQIVKLKSCPFCGGEAELRNNIKIDGGCHYTVKYIVCKKCGAKTTERGCDGYYNLWCTDEEIAELWNQRV